MLRLGHISWFSLALFAAAGGSLRAASLDKVWAVDLKQALQSQHLGVNQSYKVRNIKFSPDGEQIAVLLDGAKIELFRTQDPKTVLREFENDFPYDVFGWSPDSQIFYSGKHVVHLADGKACDLPALAITPHFIGQGSLVALLTGSVSLTPDGRIDRQHPGLAHLRIYDANCEERDSWDVLPSWLMLDASPDRGLLLISELVAGSPWTAQMIVDPFKKKILHSWSPQADAPRGRFTDQGRFICGRVCWDVDTGRQAAPDHSFRYVLDEYKQNLFSAFAEMAARRRVLDFNSGKEVISWRLNFITYGTRFDLDGYYRDRGPIPCAISPNGEYIVEGGDGKIWLYKIQL